MTRLLFDLTFHHQLTTNDISLMDFGFFMGTTEGIAAAAVPDPETSGDNPGWMYRGRMLISGASVDAPELSHIEKDIHGQRRFGAQDRDLALVMHNGVNGSVADLTGIIRLLIKLP